MMTARRLAVLLGLSACAYALAVRPRLLHWGGTEEEVRRPYPGSDVVSGGERGATMAVTIDAPPSQVWPWLVQMGCDRAGWYSWDRLDNGGRPSAERIHPEWQGASGGPPDIDPERQHLVRGGGAQARALPGFARGGRPARPP